MAPLPAELGFRMPAEWEPHTATWIAWPHRRDDWPGKFSAIPWVYTEIVRHLHQSERVCILVNGKTTEGRAGRQLWRAGVDLSQVDFFRIKTDRGWTRDSGPLFVTNPQGEIAITSWNFNGWAKYADWENDTVVPERIGAALRLRVFDAEYDSLPVVLEGGSIDVNGEGLLLTTEQCLLGTVQVRNPGLKLAELERVLEDYLGIRKVIWLGRGICGDDTHGHVDDLARFVGPNTVVTVIEKNTADPNYDALENNLGRLRDMRNLHGRPLEVVTLPMPEPVSFAEQRLPASYANFYIANDRVLVPTFNDPNDRLALGILADLFPGRKVVGIHALDLVWGFGTLHCLTQQQPRV